jgi:hypothetical protein
MARRPLRDVQKLRRRPGAKPPRSITLIICEGETEQVYFEAARINYGLTTAEIILAENTVGPAPISVVQCAEKKCAERGGYDQVFCVFDRDGHESYDRARQLITALAKRKKKPLPVREAVSVPCFEFWVLLHFERTDAPFENCTAVIQRIRDQHHIPEYKKADSAIAGKLMTRIGDALANATWVEDRAESNAYNPYTSVRHVIEHFAAVAAKGGTP